MASAILSNNRQATGKRVPDLVFFCGYYEVVKLAITLRLLPFLLQGFTFCQRCPSLKAKGLNSAPW